LEAMVDEAHRIGKKVAAHAMGWDGIDAALTAHVDSIEHGDGLTDDLIEREAFTKALKRGVRITYGTDVGGYAWTENQAKEFSIMVRYGMSPMAAIKAATSVAAGLLDPICPPQAASCPGNDLGTLAPGKLADLIAVAKDPLKDV